MNSFLNKVKLVSLSGLMLISIVTALPPEAYSLTGNDFQAGRIIDDDVFYARGDISASTIQAFLNSKVPNCDTNHAARDGNNPPFTCLKDYRQDTPTKSAENGLCDTYNGGNKSSAQIIYEVSQACGVSAKALLVLLEKEQSLVTDTWPWNIQYQSATGYGCPDTAPCDAEYYGFFNQIYNAARQFKRYQRDTTVFRYRSGRNNYIQYNPNAGCGGSDVFIQNQATASLYNYTPYQPNSSALANLNGSGDSCGAYGNRNFWKLFTDWFGPTTSNSTANTLNFVRLNHYSGKIELIGYPSIGAYGYISKNFLIPFPSDPSVIPAFRPNGDLSFIKLNDPSGKVLVTTYGSSSNFQQLSSQIYLPYPAVPSDGSVIPMFKPNGDISLVRLNHYSGHVEVVTYGFNGYFQQLVEHSYGSYPAVPSDGSVIPLFRPSGDLSFIRLNHYSGHVEVVTYGGPSNFQQFSSQIYLPYPSVPTDGSVVPMFKPNGDISLVRLNHYSGTTEVVAYGFNGYFQQMVEHVYPTYPSITDFPSVKAILSK